MEFITGAKCIGIEYRKSSLILEIKKNGDVFDVEIGRKFKTAFAVLCRLDSSESKFYKKVRQIIKDAMPPVVDIVIEAGRHEVQGDFIMAWAKEVLKKVNHKKINAD